MEKESVHCCVTSPPYWGLRDYGVAGQLGLEPTPDLYVEALTQVFREVSRVLRPDGTLWLNLGDCYATSGGAGWQGKHGERASRTHTQRNLKRKTALDGLKPKDLVGIPWMMAFALRREGWYLRSEIIWAKPNPIPESVKDRPTKSHEHLFLLSKNKSYFFDSKAFQEPCKSDDYDKRRMKEGRPRKAGKYFEQRDKIFRTKAKLGHSNKVGNGETRNRRTVWTITTKAFAGAHFATFPQDLIEPCILAGSPVGGTVLDPFFGAGTTGLVAVKHRRKFVGIELNESYCELARERIGLESYE